jgi:hypothetical protein
LTNRLKTLQVQKSQLELEIANINKELKELSIVKLEKVNKVKSIQKEIIEITADITISEHAVLRFLERVRGEDLESIKQQILSEDLKKQIQVLGDGTYPVKDFKVLVRNNIIVTVTTNGTEINSKYKVHNEEC